MKKPKNVEAKKKKETEKKPSYSNERAYPSVSPSGHYVFNDPMDTWAHDWT